jgi:hypothetical protein
MYNGTMDTDTYTLLESEVNDWLAYASVTPYDAQSRAKYKAIRERICMLFRDYRAAHVANCKVTELPERIVQVSERTLRHIATCRAKEEQDKEDLRKELLDKLTRASREALVNLIWDQKEDYIRGFDSVTEGVSAWDCLIDSIRYGYITRDNLAHHGITI